MASKFLLAIVLGTKLALGATATYASRPPFSTIEPSASSIIAAEPSATALSPTSNVPGVAFDRIVQIWLENTDYDKASTNSDLLWLASQGIALTNYYAVTHPSEPNYIASVGGDTFGMDNDDFNQIPANISTVVDLLDTKGISWGEYQEHIPYPGFQGFNWSNQVTYANDYVRKHNPLVIYESVTSNATRLSLIKSFDSFASDLAAKTLPQWSFVTPNMTNDGHDTTIAFTSSWARGFIAPLLNNNYFMNNTLLILTFDEDETYTNHNNMFTILLGGAIPTSLHGSTDSTFYNHYSMISTVSQNWGLPSLGRWDCNANVFALVANKTGHTNTVVDTTNLYFNSSYPGPLSDAQYLPSWPVPATNAKCLTGSVLGNVATTWGKSDGSFNYTNVYPYDQMHLNDVGGSASTAVASSTMPSTTSAGSPSSTSSTPASTSSKSAAAGVERGSVVVAFAAVGFAALLVG
ncbi:phosphoesterase-domain-containing protein [Mollisia scopiformis]|uniref:acid phosphatase n=1 Tax=Mollisia scopiformis TaxID=149040 RepID=A0A194XSW6_MOLSC|nr:phosphoesterase-domain-containing protein [Mollisia scopiformis]KUJ23288.1 phosphoesterase-domain-containing protein [Mollisia scopiformis]